MHPRPEPVRDGEESVWDYPRPPSCEPEPRRLRVVTDGILADTMRGHRVLETSHPPVYYFPAEDVDTARLRRNGRETHCEWKGQAVLYDLVEPHVQSLAWRYPEPEPGYEAIRGHFAFYAGRIGDCFVGDERVTPQPGEFYGGWITQRVKGPFKGIPGSWGW